MRPLLPLFTLLATVACRDDDPLAPAGPSVVTQASVVAVASPVASRLIICRDQRAPARPLYLVNDELVHDSTGSRLAQLHGARVEIVPEEIALRLYGSRATAGVFRVWLDSSHVQAR